MLAGVTRHSVTLPIWGPLPPRKQALIKEQKYPFVILDPIKHVLGVYWTTSKTFLAKRVSMELITMTHLWTLEISIGEKHYVWNYYARKSHLTHV